MNGFFDRKANEQAETRLSRDDLLQIHGVLELAEKLDSGKPLLWSEVYSRLSETEREALGIANRGSQNVSAIKEALFSIRLFLDAYQRGVDGDAFLIK